MSTHYWVFSDEQLAEALDVFFRTVSPVADDEHSTATTSPAAARDIMVEFLHSPAVIERGMRRE